MCRHMHQGLETGRVVPLGQMALYPAAPVAALLVFGIALHEVLPTVSRYTLGSAAVFVALALLLFRFGRVSSLLIGVAIFLAGAALADLHHFRFPSNYVVHFASDAPRLAMLELDIDQAPRILSGFGQFRSLPPKQVTTARVLRIKGNDGWIDAQGGILVQISQPHPRLAQGQIVRVMGSLQRPSPAMNPGQFDWASYYRQQGVLASINIPYAENVQILAEHSPGVLAWLREKSRRLLAAGYTMDRSLDHALTRALLLGDNDPELRDVQEQFRRTGTSHHLAISGLHVAVLGGVVFFFCRLLRLSPRACAWTMMIFVGLYGAVAMPSPPVIRSVLLTIGFGVGILSKRSINALQVLCVCAMAMLCWNPMDLYNAGFQLSYGTVLGLIVISPLVKNWLHDPENQIVAQQKNLRGLRRRTWLKLRTIVVTSMIAWLVSLPLIAYHFEQLNPWAIIAGIALAPFVFLALIGGFCKVMLSIFWPGLSARWAWAAFGPMSLMRRVLGGLAKLPGSDVPLPAPSIPVIIVFYGLLLLPFLPWKPVARRKKLRWISPLLAFLLIVVYPLHARWSFFGPTFQETRVTLLAIGAGQCCVIAPPSAPASLIDVGSVSLGDDLVRKSLAPFLRQQGRREVSRIFMTHGDYDHISSVYETMQAYDVREVLSSPHFRRHASESPATEALLDTLDRNGESPRQVSRGDRIDLGGDVKVSVLWPTIDTDFNSNNCGLVLKLASAGRTIILPADIQDPAMKELLKNPQQLKCDVLIAPHHGSSEGLTAAFVSACDPKYIVSSNDRTLSQKQVRFEQIIGDRPLFRTNRDGALTIVIRSDGRLSIRTHLQR